MTTIQFLQRVPFLEGLGEAELEALVGDGQVRSFPKSTLLMNEGDDTSSLFILLEGKVKVFLSDEDGKEVILSILGPGDHVGEIALLDDQPRSASVMTMLRSRFLVLSRDRVRRCLLDNPELALRSIRGLTRRVRVLTDTVRNLALNKVYGRVVATLMQLSDVHGADGERVLRERLTHQDIADMVGASREMVSRILKDLSTGGYISAENRRIVIHRTPPADW